MATRDEIYLAALLHDIGKFWQRADEHGSGKSQILSDYIKNSLRYEICPENQNGLSHKHVLWTAQFFEKYNQVFRNLIQKGSMTKYGDLMKISAAHHNPGNIYERIIQKADHYSAGMDRTMENGWKDAEEENDDNWDAFKRISMRPIFSVIGENIETNIKAPVSPLNISDSFIEYKETEYNYRKLWDAFENEFELIQNANFKAFTETLSALLEKYTTRIPASTRELPDVSLYDHLKTTAAFAICIYDFLEKKNKVSANVTVEDKPFLLVGGDLSGIQKFIYTITPRRAAKNLKGRSFYLNFLIDNIVNYIIDELNLYTGNIIYYSGGTFYIIAPNTKDTTEKLLWMSKNIEEKIFKYHKTELYLAVEYVQFGEEELFGNIGNIWHTLTEQLGQKKAQRFKNIIINDYDRLFKPGENLKADGKRDCITGEPITGKGIPLDKDNYDTLVNSYTYKQIELGQKLKEADFWIQSKEKIEYWKDACFEPIELGYYNYFVSVEEIKKKETQLKSSADNIRIKRINNIDFLEPVQKGIENIYSFTLYGGNDYPKENENPKLFEELAGIKFKDAAKEEKLSSPGLVRLGILRMDVDNLGNIFKEGFRNYVKPSFSRYSTLSRNLDIFFKGYLNTIWYSKPEYKEYTQIIYSGGDDLFIAGKWDVLIDMAVDVYDKFKTWTCNNENFGISGGIAVVPPKFPLLKSALLAAAEEQKAKNHKYEFNGNTKEKNSFSLFGFPFRWNEEMKKMINIKNEIKSLLDKEILAQNFPSDVFNLMNKAYPEIETVNKDKSFKYKVKWLVAYNFKRAIQRHSDEEIKNFLNKWINAIMTGKTVEIEESKYDALQILSITARWADYELRSKI